MMNSVTLKIDDMTLSKMEQFYHESISYGGGDYILWKCRTIDDVNITIYSSKKGIKALFSGDKALEEAKIWDIDCSLNQKKEKKEYSWLYLKDQIGSDEVGTGDFFGPVIVVASFIKKEDIPTLISLKVNDSKKLSDERIIEIVPKLLELVTFSKLTLSNEKYNSLVKNGYSMNKIKAILHNHALLKVKEKINNEDIPCFVDQFCDVGLYYSYLQYEDKVITKNITFKTKGESQYPSVAVSSMIARYCFLKEIEILENKYQVKIPKGAGLSVDNFAKEFIAKFGLDELNKICKMNFKNYEKING